MSLSRRQFLSGIAYCALGGLVAQRDGRAAEARVISWPSRVVQLPADDSNRQPPVVTALRLHAGGQQLATAGDDHRIHVWNLADGRLIYKLEGHTDWVRTVDYSPDGRLLASAGNDRQIILWDVESGAKIDRLAVPNAAIAAIRFSHCGRWLAAAGFDEFVRLYEIAGRRLIAQPAAGGQDLRTVAFSPEDEVLAVGGRSGWIRMLSLPGGDLVRDIAAHRQRIRAIVFSSDGSFLASSGEDRLVHILPAGTAMGYNLPPRPAKVHALAFYGPQQLAVAGSDNLIRLWDVAAKEEIGILRGHTGTIAALDCQDKVLVSAGYDTTVRIWEVGDQVAGEAAQQPGRVGARPSPWRPR